MPLPWHCRRNLAATAVLPCYNSVLSSLFVSSPRQVATDNSGLGSNWLLEYVEIMDVGRGSTQVFPCDKWFDHKRDPMSLQQTLLPITNDFLPGVLSEYKITVHTSDKFGAGSSSNVSILLHGDKVSTRAKRSIIVAHGAMVPRAAALLLSLFLCATSACPSVLFSRPSWPITCHGGSLLAGLHA